MSKLVPVATLTVDSDGDDASIGLDTTSDAGASLSAGQDRVGQLLEGRYSLVRKIDEGGMGVVYEGRHLKLDRRVAVKVMDATGALAQSRLERFHREAQSLARFHSPHVVSAIDFGTTPDGVPFLIMDYLDGQDLRRILNEFTSLSVERTLKLVGDAIKGVQAAHREGYVHRDLKPENLFVTRNVDGSEHCRVLDFGIVKVPGAPTLTADGGSVGTAGYMAPEQVRGQKESDVRMDVFALGAILYECISGLRAISGRSVEDVLLRTMRGEVPKTNSMPNVPRELCAIVVKALAFEPGARYQSVSELGEALRAFAETESVVQATEPVVHGQRSLTSAVVRSAVLLATIALTFVGWWWWWTSPRSPVEVEHTSAMSSAPVSDEQSSRPSESDVPLDHPRANQASKGVNSSAEAVEHVPVETPDRVRTFRRPPTAQSAPVLDLEDNPY